MQAWCPILTKYREFATVSNDCDWWRDTSGLRAADYLVANHVWAEENLYSTHPIWNFRAIPAVEWSNYLYSLDR